MVTAHKWAEHIDGEAIHVGEGEHTHNSVAWICWEVIEAELDVGPETAVGKHHTLGETCGA